MDVSTRFRLIPVRSPLLGESHMLSFPPGTKMFQFPGCPLSTLYIQMEVTGHYSRRVPPFGNLEIIACMQLPQAYRRLHVLHRHSAPRHPPDALYSLKQHNQKPMLLEENPKNNKPIQQTLALNNERTNPIQQASTQCQNSHYPQSKKTDTTHSSIFKVRKAQSFL